MENKLLDDKITQLKSGYLLYNDINGFTSQRLDLEKYDLIDRLES